MFKVKKSVLNFFKLILKILFEFTLNAYHKGPENAKVLLEKGFELFLGQKNICTLVESMTILILGLAKTNASIKKINFKQGIIGLSSLSNIEKIFPLLAKLMIVYI